MRKSWLYACLLLSGIFVALFAVSCGDDGDWEPSKTISLDGVSLKIPKSWKPTDRDKGANVTEYGNDYEGNMVAIVKIIDVDLTADELLESMDTLIYAGINPDIAVVSLPGGFDAVEYSGAIDIVPNSSAIVGMQHTMIAYAFGHAGSIYAVEFSWSPDYPQKSRQLMSDILKTLRLQ